MQRLSILSWTVLLLTWCLASQVKSQLARDVVIASISVDRVHNTAIVSFTNNGLADITGFAVTLTMQRPSGIDGSVPNVIDFLPGIAGSTVYPEMEGTRGLPPGASYKTTMPVPAEASSVDIRADVLAVTFMDRSALGEPEAIERILDGRRAESTGICSAADSVDQVVSSNGVMAALRETGRQLKTGAVARLAPAGRDRELAQSFHEDVAAKLTHLANGDVPAAEVPKALRQYATYLRTRCSLTLEHSKKGDGK